MRESRASRIVGRWLATGACLAMLAAWSAAQDVAGNPEWRIVSLAEAAGLERATIFMLAEGENGSLWIATAGGLIHYDGYTWRRYGSRDGLPSDYVRCVLHASNGDLWVGTDSGAGVFDGETFDARGSSGNLAGISVRRIVEDPEGTLWFCCDRWPDRRVTGGLTRFRKGEWKSYGTADGLPSDYVSDFFVSTAGERFVLTRHGVASMQGENFREPWTEAGLPSADGYVWSMVESSVFGLMAGTGKGFFLRRPGGEWEFLKPSVPGSARPKLLATADGDIVMHAGVQRDRFFVWDGDRFVSTGATGFVHDVEAEYLLETGDGSVWCAGQGMLLRWQRSGGAWSYLGDLEPQSVDGDGILWATDARGSHRLVEDRWVPVPAMFPPLIVDGDGVLWGRCGDGLGRWTGRSVEHWPSERLGLARVDCWIADGRDGPWVAGLDDDGQARVGRVGHELLQLPAGLRCRLLTATQDGGVLCMAELGGEERFRLFRVAYSVERIPIPDGVQIYEPPLPFEDSHRQLWLFGFFGLMVRREADWQEVQNLPGRHVTCVLEHGDAIWVGSRSTTGGQAGLTRLSSLGTSDTYPFTVLSHTEPTSGGSVFLSGRTGFLCILPPFGAPRVLSLPVPATVRRTIEHDGSLWIGTNAGMFRYAPDGIPPQTLLDASPDSIPDRESVALHVRAVARNRPWSPEEHYLVSVKVDDGPWRPFEPLLGTVLRLGRLECGDHVISVRAMDADGDVDPTPAVWRFSVLPEPLQNFWWFWALLGLGLSAMGILTGMALRSRSVRTELRRRLAWEERYRVLVEHSPHCIHELDLGGTLVSINAAGLRMLESESAEQVVGRHFTESAREEDRDLLREQFERAVQGETCEYRFTSVNGRIFRSLLAPARDAGGRVVRLVGVSEDVTERLQLESQLQHARKMEAMGRLAGGVAHDFNNILTAVLGNIGLARELAGESLERDPALRDLIAEIERAGNRAAGMTRQLLAFARQQPIRPEILKPGEVVAGMRGLLDRLIPSTVKASMRCSEIGLRVRMDRTQLEQIVMNLALNGAEAMPHGGELVVTLEEDQLSASEASMRGLESGRYVVLRVRDTGTGMDRKTLEQVFEPFFSTKPAGHGTGLGLATVHGIVQQAGGHVEVSSQPGGGSCFSVYLPAAAEPAAAATTKRPEPSERGHETLLLCEDEESVRVLLQAVLSRFGYRVLAAASGDEALAMEAAHDGPLHMLITDLVMPGMGGRALSQAFLERRRGAAVLFISGYVAEGEVDGGSLLAKPFSTPDLLRAVRRCLDESRIS